MNAPNDLAVRRALEAAGVEFIDENGGGPGYACEGVTGKGLKGVKPRFTRDALTKIHGRSERRCLPSGLLIVIALHCHTIRNSRQRPL